jgi:Carboxypeptidase regulatory-like domain
MKYLFALTFSLLLVVVSSPVSAANARGASQKVRRGISGRITEPLGALVAGARITIVGRSSHTTVVKTSNAKGEYAADLDPDTYDVTVAAPGFKPTTRHTGVVRGSRSYMDFVLYPGPTGNPIVIQ